MDDFTLNNGFFLAAIIGMFALILAESALSGSWNRFYFTFGLPIYIKRIPVSVYSFPALDFARLEAEFSGSWNNRSLVFKELDTNLFAFREKMLELRGGKTSSQVMHGVIRLDQEQQQVVVIGYANFWLLGLAALFAAVAITIGTQGLLFVGFFLVIMVIVYLAQAHRFGKVAQSVAQQVTAGRN